MKVLTKQGEFVDLTNLVGEKFNEILEIEFTEFFERVENYDLNYNERDYLLRKGIYRRDRRSQPYTLVLVSNNWLGIIIDLWCGYERIDYFRRRK